GSFPLPPDDRERVDLGPRLQAALELRLQLVAAAHLQFRVGDDEATARGSGNRAVDGVQPAREQIPVDVEAAPALAIVAVADVELRARVLMRPIRTREGEHAR